MLGDIENSVAFIQLSALSVDDVSDFESWQEYNTQTNEFIEKENLKIPGDCSKIQEDDWKRRRQTKS